MKNLYGIGTLQVANLMRKTNEFGVPESSEFIEELDDLFVRLEKGERLSPEEAAIREVYGTIGFVEGDGLHQFWAMDDDPNRIMDSFRLVGAATAADLIEESRWVTEVVERGVDSEGQYQYTPEEDSRLSEIEERVYESFIGLPTKLLAFAKESGVLG